jgi:hypothetical protein
MILSNFLLKQMTFTKATLKDQCRNHLNCLRKHPAPT